MDIKAADDPATCNLNLVPGSLSYRAPRAEQYNTRKTIKQTQAVSRYERQLSAQDISVMAYAVERNQRSVYSLGGS